MTANANWLCVSLTLEEELQLERQVREVESSPHREEVNKLCAALVRQNVLQQRIIKQACGYVAMLEMQQLLEGRDTGPRWRHWRGFLHGHPSRNRFQRWWHLLRWLGGR